MLETLFAMDPATIFAFMAAGIVLNLTPGADVMFATACGLSGGWRAGVAASGGVALGAVLHVGLATVGLSAALMAVPHAMEVIRYAGAAYLLWLAVHAWNAPPPEAGKGTGSALRAIRKGFVTNALNPKVAIFIMAFLPQFLTPGAGPVWQQTLVLGAIFIVTGFFITGAYGALAGIFGGVLAAKARLLNRISAVIFGGLAARIVFD